MRQRQDSGTVSDAIARKIKTPLSFLIKRTCRLSTATSSDVSDPLDASPILFRRLCYCFCSIRYRLPPPTHPSLLYIPRVRRLAHTASAVFSDPSDASSIPLWTPPSLLLSPRACLTLMTMTSLSIP